MKTTQELFEILDSSEHLHGHRALLREYLLGQVDAYDSDHSEGESIAYDIAGLMPTKAISSLPKGDPYEELISLAGDLELPAAHRDTNSTWERFSALVRNLPDQP